MENKELYNLSNEKVKNRKGSRVRYGKMIHNEPMTKEKALSRLTAGKVSDKEINKFIKREWFSKEELQKLGYGI